MQVPININKGISDEEAEKVVKGLAPKKVDMQQGIDQIKKFYKLFTETDCTQVEVYRFSAVVLVVSLLYLKFIPLVNTWAFIIQ